MSAPTSKLFQSLTLPNGQTIPNRLCKAAMEENLSDEGQIPGSSYESPAMQGRVSEKEGKKTERSLRREAYFVDFAREIDR